MKKSLRKYYPNNQYYMWHHCDSSAVKKCFRKLYKKRFRRETEKEIKNYEK